MPYVSMTKMLHEAKIGHYAVAQINLNSFQWADTVLSVAEETKSPVILATSDRLVDFLGGFEFIAKTVQLMLKTKHITVPVALHLDHGTTVERCKQAIDAGYSSVMYDGSNLPIEKNILHTKEVVNYARKHGVSVEAEVGTVGGNEDGLVGGIRYANPDECERLVNETNVNALAAALGSVHGHYKGKPKLGFMEMQDISSRVSVPLVLHGGSGIPLEDLQKAIDFGHAKINVNTECMQAFTDAIRDFTCTNPNVYEYRLITENAMKEIGEIVKGKFRQFNSFGKAFEIEK